MRLYRTLPWLVMALIPFAVTAQSDTTKLSQVRDTTMLNPMLVIEQAFPVLYLSLPEPLHMGRLDRGTIAASVATDLPAILKGIPGVDIRERGPHDVQADIALRGGSFEQSLILLNGVPYNDPQTGHHSLNLPFSLSDIKHITVSGPGGMNTPHSGNAMSGVVAIATKTNTALRSMLQTEVSVGSFGHRRGYAAVMFPTQRVGHYISVEASESEGYIPNTDFNRRHLWYSATRKTGGHGRITFQGGWMNKAFGANSFYTAKYPNQFEEISTAGGMLLLEGGQRFRWSGYLSSRLHHDRFELFREDAPEWYAGHNYHRTHINSIGFNGSHKSKYGITTLATHFRHEQILSNVLGEPSDTLPVKGADAQYTRAGQRHQGEATLQHQLTIKEMDVAAQFTTALLPGGSVGGFPSLRVSHPFRKHALQLVTAISRNYRLPTFTELYYKGPTNTGNPLLQHEEAITIEAGVTCGKHPFYTSATVYLRDNKNLIDWVKEDGETMWRSENLTRITTLGVNWYGTVILPVTQWFPRNISLGYAWAHQNKNTPQGTLSYYILDHLRHKWNLEVLQRPLNGRLNITWHLVWQQRAGTYTDLTGSEQPYPDALLLNVKAQYRVTEVLELALRANNVLETSQFDFSGVPLPGRWITGSVVIRTPFGV